MWLLCRIQRIIIHKPLRWTFFVDAVAVAMFLVWIRAKVDELFKLNLDRFTRNLCFEFPWKWNVGWGHAARVCTACVRFPVIATHFQWAQWEERSYINTTEFLCTQYMMWCRSWKRLLCHILFFLHQQSLFLMDKGACRFLTRPYCSFSSPSMRLESLSPFALLSAMRRTFPFNFLLYYDVRFVIL